MTKCPSCSREIPEGSRSCPYCAAAVDAGPGVPTVTARPQAAAGAHGPPGSTPSDAIDHARFTPGTMLTERYRLVGLLGKGGMGEVYRADDLKLRQPVALKFLPKALADHPGRLQRFHNEVRVARQVSHPNVCRVYDIGEADGEHFISMEYIDGEDLASLIRRIGALPKAKANQIARQLCAGLEAAHAKGVLHRDLKPHNVMIDSEGKVRITDFGLAGFADEIGAADVGAGTPGYMAPEQLQGREVTIRSDIYSLGLVLYHMFTGRAAFKADTRAEMLRLRGEGTVATPSSIVDDMDAAVERIIMHCLEPDPGQRPSSALAVAAALPGGDPLAAALAAGETPSPDMVADAGGVGGLRPVVAGGYLLGVALLLAGFIAIQERYSVVARVPLDKPPAVLVDRAREIARNLGYADPPRDWAYGFHNDVAYLDHIESTDDSPDRWDQLASGRPHAIYLSYRSSPQRMVPANMSGKVQADDPPFTVPGMVRLHVDTLGRLAYFAAVPPAWAEGPPPEHEPDWSILFDQADLDPADFTRAAPIWTVHTDCDYRAAWVGACPENTELELRVEAGSFRDRCVHFEVLGPWETPPGLKQAAGPDKDALSDVLFTVGSIPVVFGGVVLAWRNLRAGRGDRKTARRLALYVFLVAMGRFLLSGHHAWGQAEWALLSRGFGYSLGKAVIAWLFYHAIEPHARRHWPQALISWTRLWDGRLRDPLVGRHVLYGCLGGVCFAVVGYLGPVMKTWMGSPPFVDRVPDWVLDLLLGGRYVFAHLLNTQVAVVVFISVFVFLLLLQIVFRRRWVAVVVLYLAFVVLMMGGSTAFAPSITWIGGALTNLIILFTLVRFGLLAYIILWTAHQVVLLFFSATFNFSAWYAGIGLVGPLVVLGIAVYGFWISLAGRPLFKDDLLKA